MVTHNETASAVDHTTGPEENFWQLSERWEKCRLESNPDWIPPADSTFRMVTGTHTGSMNGEFHVYKPGLIFEQYPDGSSAYGPAVGPSPEYGLLVQGDWVGYYLDPSMTKKVMRNLMNFRQGITTAILERIGPLEAQSPRPTTFSKAFSASASTLSINDSTGSVSRTKSQGTIRRRITVVTLALKTAPVPQGLYPLRLPASRLPPLGSPHPRPPLLRGLEQRS
jgi:hypothetical protein